MIDLRVRIVECGLFQSLCHALVDQFKTVEYYRDSNQSFPTANDIAIGTGYDFRRVYSLWEDFDDVDIWIFPDIGYGDFQEWLKKQGKRTFGSGVAGEFEQYRVEAKEIIKEAGLLVNKFDVVVGMDALREYLEKHEDVYVKLSMARGVTESFHSATYDLVKVKLDEIEHKLGGMSEQQEWIIEQPIKAIGEIGYDGVTVRGKFWKTGIAGVEKKDCGYFGAVKPYEMLPKALKVTNAKLSAQFEEWDYCGWWSTEQRGEFLIDPTCRMASPAGESYLTLISNWGEIIEAGSRGVLVEPKWQGKYAAQAMLLCNMAMTQWVPVQIDAKVRDNVFLYHSAKIDGVEYVIPTDAKMAEIGSCVGIGNTPDEAIKMCQRVCEGVKAYGLTNESGVLDEARKELAKFMPL